MTSAYAAKFGIELNRYWRSLLGLVYPAYCTLCRIPLLIDERYLCDECTHLIEPLKAPLCLRCARSLPPYGDGPSTCSHCRSERPYFDRGYALVNYGDPVKTIFHQIKFQKKPWLLKVFFNLVQNLSASLDIRNYELIVPVPLDSRRERERGFNQAFSIARMLKRAIRTALPEISTLLKKRKRTAPQSQLRRTERLNNLIGAFSIKAKGLAQGKHILLVDDIFTTGATINECAHMLKEDGAERVDFFTLARSQAL